MQTRTPFFEDLAKAMESAVGLAQAAGEEAKSAFRAQGDRVAAEFDLVRRDELDAVRDTLMAEIAKLRADFDAYRDRAAADRAAADRAAADRAAADRAAE